MRTRAQQVGDAAEDLVAARLGAAGWVVLARKLHLGRSEVDLLAIDPGPPARLVVVEVRWRRPGGYGTAEETFDQHKQHRLRLAIGRLLAAGRLPDGRPLPRLPIAGDLVVVAPGPRPGDRPAVRHHRDALPGR